MKFATVLSIFAVSSAVRIQTMELDKNVQSALELLPADLMNNKQTYKCIKEEVKRIEALIEEAEEMTEAEAKAFVQSVHDDIYAGTDETIGALVVKIAEPHASGALGMTQEEEEAALEDSYDRIMACLGLPVLDDDADPEQSEADDGDDEE